MDMVNMSRHKADAERWWITNAGLGKVFIQRQKGTFLQDFQGDLKLTPNADEWEKWKVETVDGKAACEFPGVKLFCFTVMRSWGHELGLMKKQYDLGAGIFGCDEFLVLSDSQKSLGSGYHTSIISHDSLSHGAGMYKNSDLFLNVWQKVFTEGRHKNADWVIK